jgi:hypothetical protein
MITAFHVEGPGPMTPMLPQPEDFAMARLLFRDVLG